MREREIAYVVKGYPRLSELFVASEIHRVEQAGVGLRLYALLDPGETFTHPLIDKIAVRPVYLTETPPLRGLRLRTFLRLAVPRFAGQLLRVARRRPLGLVRGLTAGVVQARRARTSGPLRQLTLKETLLAVDLSDRLLAEPGVTHLHAHFAHSPTTVTWLAARITGLPFSFTAHAKDIYDESLNPAGLLRRKLEAARFVVTCTEANRAHLIALAPTAAIHRVYHGLNAELGDLLDGAPPPAPPDRAALRVVAVGRLVPKKGFDVLIEACALLVAGGVDVRCRIIGPAGEAEPALRDLIAARGLDQVVDLAGPMRQAELALAYRAADVFALPCRILDSGDRDGIPNVMVEALAAGLPIVTTPISGIPELIVDGETGLLVAPDDPPALAAAIARLYTDREFGARLARNGAREVRERFDGDRLARELARLFAGVPA
jgi:glycosyltransferase involved in cell wall biosynthesis